MRWFVRGLTIGTGVGIGLHGIPFTGPALSRGIQVRQYSTVLTQGLTFRARVRGRLYGADFWRE